ncbi:class II aldolase/adducin family protein [Rhodopirellula sallentina]|uniref:Short chain dehydrogenase n=1 Tax=Rhodopirellula sallentina SM41 TaxID=1263870 RepID=M5U3C8_9BACT|nr:class II aldolase/adducin family protein [Rhodopirellula sallentina]EMI55960.1 short chain dehydrogenase [Rhodopirellula sallentina SM41]
MACQTTENELLELSHFLGQEDRDLAILGEGNTSAKIDDDTFLVKASGSCLETLGGDDVVACRFDALLPMLDQDDLTDQQIEDHLLACRVDPESKKPSVETLFHAYLLSLPGVNFVGHTHSIPVNQILCSPMAEQFATQKLFPDEIVCCGARSVFVPYTDPGLRLSQVIREKTQAFADEFGAPPRVILLANHGLITLGKTPGAVKAAMLMAHKSAEIFVGAAALGGPVFLSDEDVDRIANRIDEHYRQKALKL